MDINFRQFDYKQDMDWIYSIYADDTEANLFVHDFDFSTKDEFEKLFLYKVINEYYCFYIIGNGTDKNMGFVYAHDHHKTDLHIKFSMYISPKFRNLGVGALCAVRFVDILFSRLPIRKVYETIFGTNEISLKNNTEAGFTREAVLKDYIFKGGEFCDLVYLSVGREKFYELYGDSALLKND